MKASIETRVHSAVMTESFSGGDREGCVVEDLTPARPVDNEQQLRAQVQELECVYQTAPIGLALIDRDFRFVRVNDRLAAISGLPVQQHIGRTLRDVLPELADRAEELCRHVLSSGESLLDVEVEGASPTAREERRVWNQSWCPIRNTRGDIVGANVTMEDITERRRVQRAFAENARIKDALYRLTDRLHRAKELRDVYDAALGAIVDALRCDRASILLYDERDVMRFVGWRDLSDGYRQAVEGHSPWRRDDADPQPVCIENVALAELDEQLRLTVLREGIRACAFIPLMAQGRPIGKFMAYFNSPHEFRADELNLCWSIARQLAFGIEHQRSVEALRDNEHRFREMIDALPTAVYTTDREGRVTHYNPAAVEFAGRHPESNGQLQGVLRRRQGNGLGHLSDGEGGARGHRHARH